MNAKLEAAITRLFVRHCMKQGGHVNNVDYLMEIIWLECAAEFTEDNDITRATFLAERLTSALPEGMRAIVEVSDAN